MRVLIPQKFGFGVLRGSEPEGNVTEMSTQLTEDVCDRPTFMANDWHAVAVTVYLNLGPV